MTEYRNRQMLSRGQARMDNAMPDIDGSEGCAEGECKMVHDLGEVWSCSVCGHGEKRTKHGTFPLTPEEMRDATM